MLAAMDSAKRLFLGSVLLCLSLPLGAANLPCRPCAGLRVDASVNPADVARVLKPGGLEPGSPLFVAWEVPLSADTPADTTLPSTVRDSGATPWISFVFRTPPPLAQGSERLQAELRVAADVASKAPAGTWFQVVWRPETGSFSPVEYAFLLKRAAVALTGAQGQGKVASEPLPADPKVLQAFYGEEVAAYLEAVSLQPAAPEALRGAVEAIQNQDPGRPIVLDARPVPADPNEMLAGAARDSTQGIDLTLFGGPGVETAKLIPLLSPLVLLAREFAGDLSWDPGSSPTGGEEAWTFVRGKDLGLRVIALAPPDAQTLTLSFNDPELRRPVRFPIGGQRVPPPGGQVAGGTLVLQVPSPNRVAVLGLDRPTAAERQGVAEKVTVSSQREIPVEEILRRLQAFEDAQNRKLEHYSAVNTTSLRFQASAGVQAIEATLQGPFFFDPKTGSDWAWETLYVNGVRWRGKTLPEIPLIQPEKAAALPLEIHFTKEYRYRLRGSDRIDGRDAWVVDFAPAGQGEKGKLYQGSVWIDKQLYSRLRTRAVQVGLEGEVLSNEETLFYTPVDANGQAAPWSAQSYILPLRLAGQQILSVVNNSTVVERETRLTDVRINAPDFAAARQKVDASDVTMVRDTAKGLRYLVKDEQGERVVKEGFKTSKLFGAGGVFYDDALDYPLPLAGINYFSFDYKGTGQQVNLFYGGVLLIGNVAQPRVFGSRFDAGAQVFAIAVPTTDTFFRNGKEIRDQAVKQLPATVSFKLGHPIGNFIKVDGEYEILYFHYGKADDTAKNFVIPASNFTHSFSLSTSFARSGYQLQASGSYNLRSSWDFWGLPGNPDFDKTKKDFITWDAAASKNWYLPKFQKVGLEFDYASGSDLDRFSKYQFGFFGGTRVHGYQSNSVRATEVWAGHASYGFEIGEAFRLDGIADAAIATDKETGLDHELLAGVGVQGTFIGPWQTVVNMDVGTPVAGPDKGFVLYLVFLKLFK
ncbi:MAG TPA: hypothetical protein VGP73_24780 [Thermoanaerobaculia bacterium]